MGVFVLEDEPIRFIIFCLTYANPQAHKSLEQVCLNKGAGEPERLI